MTSMFYTSLLWMCMLNLIDTDIHIHMVCSNAYLGLGTTIMYVGYCIEDSLLLN